MAWRRAGPAEREDRAWQGSGAMMAMTTTPLPRIAVIGTGGTISSIGASSLDLLDYPDFGQKLSCEALLDRFPEARLVADPVPVTFRPVCRPQIGPGAGRELPGPRQPMSHVRS